MKRFQNILAAVDTRYDEQPGLELAIRLAVQYQAKLKIVDVLPELSWIAKLSISDTEASQQAVAEQKCRDIDALAASAKEKGIDVSTQLLRGKSSVAIMGEVSRSGHDLVVRVSKGAHSGRTGFFGTTSLRLLRECPCPIWLVRPGTLPRFSRVLAAIDPAPQDASREAMNSTIFELAQSICEHEQGQLHVVHAWEMFGEHLLRTRSGHDEVEQARHDAEIRITEALDSFLKRYELSHESDHVHLVRDTVGPGHAIWALAKHEKIDLVVMGTIARTGLTGALMGNTAEEVLDHIECSVLAIKPE